MNVDRNVLHIVDRFIHESFTRDLLDEYHSCVKPECDNCIHNVCYYCIRFNNLQYNHRDPGDPYMQRYIYNLNGSPIFYNQRYLKVPINY